jgi:hypothetical protein
MYFYVFLQPEIFREAQVDGEDAIDNVASILGGFEQNCFIAVFEDAHWEASVKEIIEAWPSTMSRRRVKSILVHFKKNRRFIYCLKPDYAGTIPDLDCVFQQAPSASLDLLLIIDSEMSRAGPPGVEVVTRRTYQQSAFEPKRADLAVNGKTCDPGEMEEAHFIDFHFGRALKYASSIHICDRVCGTQNLSDNFHYTIKRFMSWLSMHLIDPEHCRICFYFGQPRGRGEEYIIQEIGSFKTGRLNGSKIEVRFYPDQIEERTLPHHRFIATDQIALGVDRGMDFIDRTTKKCRDTYINYQDPAKVQTLICRLPDTKLHIA